MEVDYSRNEAREIVETDQRIRKGLRITASEKQVKEAEAKERCRGSDRSQTGGEHPAPTQSASR